MENNKANTEQPSSPTRSRRLSGPAFEGLMNQKRSTENQARRQSIQDQRPQPGIFGQMWNNFTRGPSSPTK